MQEATNLSSQPARRKVPRALVYEMDNGKPIFYRNYRKVLKGEISIEEVMASSSLQSYLIELILDYLRTKLSKKEYILLTNELGLWFNKGSYRAADISIFPRKGTKEKIMRDKYIDIPPKIVIEVDTKADLTKTGLVYYYKKTESLLQFGVEKVIWIFTSEEKIMTATNDKEWNFFDWNEDIEIMKGLSMNLQQLIETDKKLFDN